MAKICSYAKQSLHSANFIHYSNISRGISHLLSDLFISSKDSLNSPKSSQEWRIIITIRRLAYWKFCYINNDFLVKTISSLEWAKLNYERAVVADENVTTERGCLPRWFLCHGHTFWKNSYTSRSTWRYSFAAINGKEDAKNRVSNTFRS